ncbi:hypothetical protein [Sulfurospirillum multivorans]|uniref:Periplasmic protein n=2 Tax=Sulfurospirillum multivorans TaxID=66821 RepID=A0AA86AMQ2_SULMK|nr:hypothetical protein [Sulfurospirillum multivorans]AHJ13099.1 hypothetical protein SMUL_1844 [Sulfurospirillum multivorans DSM 12446]QEH06587.1 hypothetical protein SMN_1822 [Sulfurospirillum multivorans]
MKKIIILVALSMSLFALTQEEEFYAKTHGGACGSAIVGTQKSIFGGDKAKVKNACTQCVKEENKNFVKTSELENKMISECVDSYFK